MLVATNAYEMMGAAFGVGVIAIVAGGAAILSTLGREDRQQTLNAIRHPLRTVFSEDEDAEPDVDE